MTNVPIQLNWRNIERLIEGMRVYYDTESNYTRIIYLAKAS